MKATTRSLSIAAFFAAATAIFFVTQFGSNLTEKKSIRPLDLKTQKAQENLAATASKQQVSATSVDALCVRIVGKLPI